MRSSLQPHVQARRAGEGGRLLPRLRIGLVLLLLLLGGCGSGKKLPPWGGVLGKVTLAGKPATPVTVVFQHATNPGIALMGNTDAEGHFKMVTADFAGLPTGDYRIYILPTYHDVPHEGLMIKGPKPEPNFPVPQRYQNEKTSGLTCTIHEGQNEVNFEMKP